MDLQLLSSQYGWELNDFENLNDLLKARVLEMIKKSFASENHLEIKKLLNNSIGYLVNRKIKKLNDETFDIKGKHGKYIVCKEDANYKCECPMYKKSGKYSTVTCQTCSHVQAVQLYEFAEEHKPNNVHLLQGDPGAGKSHCTNAIIDKYPGDSMSIAVNDTHVFDVRDSFNLVVRKGKIIVSQNTFATRQHSTNFDHMIGKWYVNPLIFEDYAVPIIHEIIKKINTMDDNENFLFVVDELGKMQSLSLVYIEAIQSLFEAIENNINKQFKGIFVVPTDDTKWHDLSTLKNKYKTFNVNVDTRVTDQERFIEIILS